MVVLIMVFSFVWKDKAVGPKNNKFGGFRVGGFRGLQSQT